MTIWRDHASLPFGPSHILGLALGGLLLLAPVCAKARTLHVVALGDSLTEGEGLPRGQAFPDELERALKLKGWDVEVVNSGYGGQTAGDALIRYDRSVPEGTDVVIIELGINDMLLRPAARKEPRRRWRKFSHGSRRRMWRRC